jgi:hypothetical protein
MLYSLRNDPWRRYLLDGADIIESRGMTKHNLHDATTGRVCMGGALMLVAQGGELKLACVPEHAREAVQKAMEQLNIACGGSFVVWNNRPETTTEMAAAKMRECALELV